MAEGMVDRHHPTSLPQRRRHLPLEHRFLRGHAGPALEDLHCQLHQEPHPVKDRVVASCPPAASPCHGISRDPPRPPSGVLPLSLKKIPLTRQWHTRFGVPPRSCTNGASATKMAEDKQKRWVPLFQSGNQGSPHIAAAGWNSHGPCNRSDHLG
jgi:hypothetical protein